MDLEATTVESPLGDATGGALTAEAIEEVAALIDSKLQFASTAIAAERDAAAGSPAPPGVDAIRRVFAAATSVPCNWHQATIFFSGSDAAEDAAMKSRARWMLLAGLGLVIFQALTAIGVHVGVALPSCTTTKQCQVAGTFCDSSQRCSYCGWHGLLSPTTESAGSNAAREETYVDCAALFGATDTIVGRTETDNDKCLPPANKTVVHALCSGSDNWRQLLAAGGYSTGKSMNGAALTEGQVKSWCESCVNAVDWETDMFTTIDNINNNINAMGFLDWITLMFAAYIVAMTVCGELKDLELCSIAQGRLGDKLDNSSRLVMGLGAELRRSIFLPGMLCNVGLLVGIRGGDSLSICFNTVAILFMAEADNMAYIFGLAEPQKARMELAGRIELTGEDAQRLLHTRSVYVPIVIVGILVTVASRSMVMMLGSGFPIMATAEVVRVFLFEETEQKAKRFGLALVRLVVGPFVFGLLFLELSGH